MVAVSSLPYVGLLKQIVRVVGPRLFAAEHSGAASAPLEMLERAFEEAAGWPPLVPGTTVTLPLLSEELQWQVPWTGLHNYRPSFIAPLLPVGTGARRRRSSASGASVSVSVSYRSHSPVDEAAAASASSARSAGAKITASMSDDALDKGLSAPPPDVASSSVYAGSVTSSSVGGGPTPAPPAQLSLSEVFAASNLELAGLFQEVGLYSVFRSLVPCLWPLWELVITGQPLLIMGVSPDRCGDAVLALVSLISPLEFCADYRPYFTLFDPDFQQVAAMLEAHSSSGAHGGGGSAGGSNKRGHSGPRAPRFVRPPLKPRATGASSGSAPAVPAPLFEPDLDPRVLRRQAVPPLILGSTNPYFTEALQSWQNAVWLGAGGGGGAQAGGGAGRGRGEAAVRERVLRRLLHRQGRLRDADQGARRHGAGVGRGQRSSGRGGRGDVSAPPAPAAGGGHRGHLCSGRAERAEPRGSPRA